MQRGEQDIDIMNIEDTIFEEAMAVNSIAAANRLIELLRENNTNSILSAKGDVGIRRLLWFLNSQCYGQFGLIDMAEEAPATLLQSE